MKLYRSKRKRFRKPKFQVKDAVKSSCLSKLLDHYIPWILIKSLYISSHAFDESEKFVKIFIPFAKSKISDENVHIEFTSTTSFNVIIKVDDHGSTDYKFSATNLLKPLNIESSYIKVS